MPDVVIYEDQVLPASYANFYISNKYVIVPTFRCGKDDQALQIISSGFPDREVVGIDSQILSGGWEVFIALANRNLRFDNSDLILNKRRINSTPFFYC